MSSSVWKVISPFQYNPGNDPSVVTYLQGFKQGDRAGTYLLVGANNSPGPTPQGLVYQGPLDGISRNGVSGSGVWSVVAAPKRFRAAGTSVYGPDNLGSGQADLVGAFTRNIGSDAPTPRNPAVVGFTYSGAVDGSDRRGWREVQGRTQAGTNGTYTFVHSVDGGLAVGNADNADVDELTGYFSLSSTAFIVDLDTGKQTKIRYPDDRNPLVTHTAYGIWFNGGSSYTIAGGSGEVLQPGSDKVEAGAGYLIDYDAVTGRFSNYTTFPYRNREQTDLISHFEGIYRTPQGHYRLPATAAALNAMGDLTLASVVTVKRNRQGGFREQARWKDLPITRSSDGAQSVLSTANSLYGDAVVGFANYPDGSGGLTPLDFVAQL
ncbi:MAG: hypothetical protein KXJ50_11450 [Vulcanococcus sp.]|uniref:hypothetical protein n=1 Tax=Vulcanococcus sp. TaxID=2856995 RepID=UPI0025D7EE41|nr:hypothetical protein [Vulcanococcus sp.]MBW0174487.1 hypothetical protein [Vulcanococcus sp.]MBW0181673.1 hypothetical protein [Vulcanococcus sp.]